MAHTHTREDIQRPSPTVAARVSSTGASARSHATRRPGDSACAAASAAAGGVPWRPSHAPSRSRASLHWCLAHSSINPWKRSCVGVACHAALRSYAEMVAAMAGPPTRSAAAAAAKMRACCAASLQTGSTHCTSALLVLAASSSCKCQASMASMPCCPSGTGWLTGPCASAYAAKPAIASARLSRSLQAKAARHRRLSEGCMQGRQAAGDA